jgi:hypothetical protein
MTVTALAYDGQFALSLLADNNLPDLPILAAGVRGGIGGLYQRSPGDGPLGTPPPSRSAASSRVIAAARHRAAPQPFAGGQTERSSCNYR